MRARYCIHPPLARGPRSAELTCDQPEDGPIDDYYTSASGTSMAAPHVAGAAALLAGARPALNGQQLKALLMGTAVPADNLSVYEQGAGEADVIAALGGQVVAAPASVSLGDFTYPHDQRDPVVRTITYTNVGEEPQTLELTVDAENTDGEAAPEESFTLSTRTLTLPASGAATVTLTLDTGVPGFGRYGGAIVARTTDGETLRTPIGYHKEPEMYNLRVEGIARDGRAALGRFRVVDVEDGNVAVTRAWGDSDDTSCTTDQWAPSNCVRVPPGTYSVSGLVLTMPQWAPSTQAPDYLGSYLNTTLVAEPEVSIDGTTTLTLDAREAVEVQIDTPDHRTKRNVGAAEQISFYREPDNGPAVQDGLLLGSGTQLEERLFVQPTAPVTHGRLAAYTKWQLTAPVITFDIVGSGALPLNPLYYNRSWFSATSQEFPQLAGIHRMPVVDAGTATAAEIDTLELDGALALVRRSDAISVPDQANNAAARGAAMVAIYNDVPGSNADPGEAGVPLQVPTVRLSHAEGEGLRQLLRQGPVTIEANGELASPYQYNLTFVEEERIPQDPHYVADADELAAVENSFHSQLSDDVTLIDTWYSKRPWENFAMGLSTPVREAPRTRTDFYVPDSSTEYLHQVATPENAPWPEPTMQLEGEYRSFQPGERVRESWFNAPVRPGLWPGDPVRRTGDDMYVDLAAFIDGDGHVGFGATSATEDGFSTRFRMYADGELLMESSAGQGVLAVPGTAEDFRIEYDVDNAAPWARLSTRTRSVWTFASSRPAEGEVRVEPLLTVDYDIDVDIQNLAPSGAASNGPHRVEFTVDHQAGAPDLPIRGTASLEVSYDSGQTWRPIRNLREVTDGRFVATLPRAPQQTDGFVSLRVRAEDREGNTVEQEVVRAYALPAR